MTANDPRSRHTLLVALTVAMGGFLFGFDAGVITGCLGPLAAEFDLTPGQKGWAVACLTAASTAFMLVAGPLADKLGRKPVLMMTAALFSVSAIGSALAPSYEVLVVARILGGLAIGGALLIAPMYIAEIAPAEQRGKLVSFNQLNIVLGFAASFFSNYFIDGAARGVTEGTITEANSWRWMLGVESVPALLYLVLLTRVPRSPRWLAAQGRDDEALAVLEQSNGPAAASALKGVQESLAKAAGQPKATLGDLFNSKMSRIMMIGLGLGFFQQITGINAIFFYATTIFDMAGAARDASLLQTIVLGIVNVVFTIIAMRLIDKAGRRPLLLIGTALMTVALFTSSFCFGAATYQVKQESVAKITEDIGAEAGAALAAIQSTVYESRVEFAEGIEAAAEGLPGEQSDELLGGVGDLAKGALELNGMLVLIAICMFIAGFAISLGPVMWAMFSEIFPLHLRGLAISVAGFFNSAVSYAVQHLFPIGMDSLGPAIVFGFFGTFAALAFVFTITIVPETKGRSLEELEEELIRS